MGEFDEVFRERDAAFAAFLDALREKMLQHSEVICALQEKMANPDHGNWQKEELERWQKWFEDHHLDGVTGGLDCVPGISQMEHGYRVPIEFDEGAPTIPRQLAIQVNGKLRWVYSSLEPLDKLSVEKGIAERLSPVQILKFVWILGAIQADIVNVIT